MNTDPQGGHDKDIVKLNQFVAELKLISQGIATAMRSSQLPDADMDLLDQLREVEDHLYTVLQLAKDRLGHRYSGA